MQLESLRSELPLSRKVIERNPCISGLQSPASRKNKDYCHRNYSEKKRFGIRLNEPDQEIRPLIASEKYQSPASHGLQILRKLGTSLGEVIWRRLVEKRFSIYGFFGGVRIPCNEKGGNQYMQKPRYS